MNKVLIDDIRHPKDCYKLMLSSLGEAAGLYFEDDWFICKNYNLFVNYIEHFGVPDLISTDHDIGHVIPYQVNLEKTGHDAMKFLIDYCIRTGSKLPRIIVHSSNPVGTENIKSLIHNFKKHQNG